MDKNTESTLLYEQESYKIRGACFKVYNELGGGIKENMVERALEKELINVGLRVAKHIKLPVFYRNEQIGIYIPDLIVNGRIVIEIKSKPVLSQEDNKQFWGYLKGSSYKLGFLLGFTPRRLIIKRFIHTEKPYLYKSV